MSKYNTRRYTTEVGEGLSVTVSYHPETNEAVEIFVTGRGKKASDGPMTDALYNLGVQASKLMQKEDIIGKLSKIQIIGKQDKDMLIIEKKKYFNIM